LTDLAPTETMLGALTSAPDAPLEKLDNEPAFVPSEDLALERLTEPLEFTSIGFDSNLVRTLPSPYAHSGLLRFLSPTGVEKAHFVAASLRDRFVEYSPTVSQKVRSAIFRSNFMAAFCTCPEVTRFLGDAMGVAIEPCTFRLQIGHLNFNPVENTREVIRWHYDTLPFNSLIMLSDPALFEGGELEFYFGPDGERMVGDNTGAVGSDRVQRVDYPEAGTGTITQGHLLYHRVAPVTSGGPRITLVNGYQPISTAFEDRCSIDHLHAIDPPYLLYPEWARHKAILSQRKLSDFVRTLDHTQDRTSLVEKMRAAISDVERAIRDLESVDQRENGQGVQE